MCIFTKKFRIFDPHLPIVKDKVLKKTDFFDIFPNEELKHCKNGLYNVRVIELSVLLWLHVSSKMFIPANSSFYLISAKPSKHLFVHLGHCFLVHLLHK